MGRLSDIAMKMDQAVTRLDEQKAAVEKAKAALDKANTAYAATVEEMRGLHKEQQAIMQDILSFGGTQHVAVGR